MVGKKIAQPRYTDGNVLSIAPFTLVIIKRRKIRLANVHSEDPILCTMRDDQTHARSLHCELGSYFHRHCINHRCFSFPVAGYP